MGGGGVWCFIGARGGEVKKVLKMFIEEKRVSELTMLKSAPCSGPMSPSPCLMQGSAQGEIQGSHFPDCRSAGRLDLSARGV